MKKIISTTLVLCFVLLSGCGNPQELAEYKFIKNNNESINKKTYSNNAWSNKSLTYAEEIEHFKNFYNASDSSRVNIINSILRINDLSSANIGDAFIIVKGTLQIFQSLGTSALARTIYVQCNDYGCNTIYGDIFYIDAIEPTADKTIYNKDIVLVKAKNYLYTYSNTLGASSTIFRLENVENFFDPEFIKDFSSINKSEVYFANKYKQTPSNFAKSINSTN